MKNFSIKRRILFILMGLIIPLIIFIIVFNLYTVKIFNKKVSEAIDNTLYLQCKNLENTLKMVENSMAGIIIDNEYFAGLRNKNISELDRYTNAYEVMKTEKTVMQTYSNIAACALISSTTNVNQIAYNINYNFDDIDQQIPEFLGSLMKDSSNNYRHKWFPAMIGDRGYLFRIMGSKDTWIIYVINLKNIILFQDNLKSDNTAITIFFDRDNIYTRSDIINTNNIELKYSDNYYFTGKDRKYMVCESSVNRSNIKIAYLTPYNGLFVNLSGNQLMFFIISLLTVLLIPSGYIMLKRMFFSPINRLVRSMEDIGNGQYNAEKSTAYREIEFRKVDETLLNTLEEIRKLKIASYEKELKYKGIMLQYFQIQIRPHFYLNCLKNIYGMVEEKNYENIQKLILYLSKHLRYMLQENSNIVTIEEELQYVKNYIEIQQISMKYPPDCTIDVETNTIHELIPPVSILSFVENSVKYSTAQSENLQIKIKIQFLINEDEELIYIRISDNGCGFTEENLQKYNFIDNETISDERIGIYNVIQRFQLYFGKENVGFAFSNDHGAVVEIYIERVQANENFDS
ncbi:MAG: hypothetical protein K0R21_571 [Anaerocolumna sp.]|nr:hypothetical protein [Anaerocolumna sp.]